MKKGKIVKPLIIICIIAVVVIAAHLAGGSLMEMIRNHMGI